MVNGIVSRRASSKRKALDPEAAEKARTTGFMLGVRALARQRRPFRAPLVMDQLTLTRFFRLVGPVLKHGPKSPTVGQVFIAAAEAASALKAPAWTAAQATDHDL